jgi:hypothetical protein
MSNFKSILKAHKEAQEGPAEETPPPSPVEASPLPLDPLPSAPHKRAAEKLRKRGRPSGKRSDVAFVQAPAWIRRDTHTQVKIELLKEGKGQEFSELVESLLSKWLKSRT